MYKFGKITISCVGDLKESYLKEAQKEYLKRLTPYGRLDVAEISENADMRGRLLKNTFKIALDIGGESPSSEDFARKMGKWALNGHSHLEFLIGGHTGLCPEAAKLANARISLSPMTFTHQMARIILLEQIYRACRILNNEPYHK